MMEIISSYVSVIGLSSLFAGDVVILMMAVILDVAKITSVSFLYQYWHEIKRLMRYYMLSAVIVLMTITSTGAFGYLSGAFQRAMQPNQEVMLKVESFNRERTQLSSELEQLSKQRSSMDQQLAQLPPENVKGRRQLIWSFKPETQRISERTGVVTKRLDQLNEDILKVESENIDKQVHTGPITYVSKAFNISVEEASKWIILTIIFVFDPLAVILIIAGNFLVKRRDEQTKKIEPIELGVTSEDVEEDKLKAPVTSQEDNEQIERDFSTIVDNTSDLEPTHETKPLHVLTNWDQSSIDQASNKIKQLPPLGLSEHEDQVIIDLMSKVYDNIETGEDPDSFLDYSLDLKEQADDQIDSELIQKVKNYIPIEVLPELILPEPMLEKLNVNLSSALFRNGVKTVSTKRHLYEKSKV